MNCHQYESSLTNLNSQPFVFITNDPYDVSNINLTNCKNINNNNRVHLIKALQTNVSVNLSTFQDNTPYSITTGSPTFRKCIISNNSADYLQAKGFESRVIVYDSIVKKNHFDDFGSVTFSGCYLNDNTGNSESVETPESKNSLDLQLIHFHPDICEDVVVIPKAEPVCSCFPEIYRRRIIFHNKR